MVILIGGVSSCGKLKAVFFTVYQRNSSGQSARPAAGVFMIIANSSARFGFTTFAIPPPTKKRANNSDKIWLRTVSRVGRVERVTESGPENVTFEIKLKYLRKEATPGPVEVHFLCAHQVPARSCTRVGGMASLVH